MNNDTVLLPHLSFLNFQIFVTICYVFRGNANDPEHGSQGNVFLVGLHDPMSFTTPAIQIPPKTHVDERVVQSMGKIAKS